MVDYKCFHCDKSVSEDYLRTRIRCPYCGSKMLYKQPMLTTHVKAR